MMSERTQGPHVGGHRVVREEAGHHRPQPASLFRDRRVHAAAQLFLDLPEFRPHAITPRLALELECPAPRRAADEREPQEGEGLRFAQTTPPASLRRKAAELQQAGLFPVQLEPELLKPRSHRIPEAPRIGLVLEAGHDIVRVADEDHVAGRLSPPPLLGPEVEDVVQVDVGKQR